MANREDEPRATRCGLMLWTMESSSGTVQNAHTNQANLHKQGSSYLIAVYTVCTTQTWQIVRRHKQHLPKREQSSMESARAPEQLAALVTKLDGSQAQADPGR